MKNENKGLANQKAKRVKEVRNFTIDGKVYSDFRIFCKENFMSMSPIVEELIRTFILTKENHFLVKNNDN